MFYDPMIAKLITWAPTREEAIDEQIAALDAFEIEGPGNNIDFLSALMQHPRFRSGDDHHRLHRRGISRRLPRRARVARAAPHARRDRRLRRDRRGRPRAADRRAARQAAAPPSEWAVRIGKARSCGRDLDRRRHGRWRGPRRSRSNTRRATGIGAGRGSSDETDLDRHASPARAPGSSSPRAARAMSRACSPRSRALCAAHDREDPARSVEIPDLPDAGAAGAARRRRWATRSRPASRSRWSRR